MKNSSDDSSDYVLIEIPVVGIQFDNRSVLVPLLRLRDRVLLQPEPENPHDPNAIQVWIVPRVTIGYFPRRVATHLKNWLLKKNQSVEGRVTFLTAGYDRDTPVQLAVSLLVPRTIAEQIRKDPISLSYSIETTVTGRYLLIESDEQRFSLIKKDLFELQGYISRTGGCYRPAKNGRRYRWYFHMDPNSTLTNEMLYEYFAGWYNTISDDEIDRLRDEQAAEIETQLATLQSEIDQARIQLDEALLYERELEASWESAEAEASSWKSDSQRLHNELRVARANSEQLQARFEERSNAFKEQNLHLKQLQSQSNHALDEERYEDLRSLVKSFFPTVEWIDTSMDILLTEISDRDNVIQKLREIVWNASAVKAIRVRNSGGYSEVHFNTGKADDGRLYFKRAGTKVSVLLSFKHDQEGDIRRLKSR